jgi:hypothetical protein
VTSDRVILQLLVDALRALMVGGEDGSAQAVVKINRAQAALLEDEESSVDAWVSE